MLSAARLREPRTSRRWVNTRLQTSGDESLLKYRQILLNKNGENEKENWRKNVDKQTKKKSTKNYNILIVIEQYLALTFSLFVFVYRDVYVKCTVFGLQPVY